MPVQFPRMVSYIHGRPAMRFSFAPEPEPNEQLREERETTPPSYIEAITRPDLEDEMPPSYESLKISSQDSSR